MYRFRNLISHSLLLSVILGITGSVFAEPGDLASRAKDFARSSEAIKKVLLADLKFADKETLLIPDHFFPPGTDIAHRVNKNRYSPHNSGADHYPFLIITSSLVAPDLYKGRMLEMLRNEVRYTNVKDGVPGNFDFNTHTKGKISLFGGAEYMKDGVIPVTEFLGRTPWYYRMLEMTKGIMNNAQTKSRFGMLPAHDSELNGDMLQVFSRLIPMTSDKQMLEWGRRISDAYIEEALPGTFGLVPTKWDFKNHKGNNLLRLRDHGNETLVGLVLMAAIEQELGSDRAVRYTTAVRNMLDKMLQSVNPDGLVYNVIDAQTLAPPTQELADNWGYVYGAVYAFYQMTGEEKYRQAVLHVLSNIEKYEGYPWEGEHYDGIADSVESALYLLSREPDESAFRFVDSEMDRMLKLQRKDGHIDQSYLEGNFNRTTIMYMMSKSQGILPNPWREGVGIGAEKVAGDGLKFLITSNDKKPVPVRFDSQRHRLTFNFPKNYARVNEFPEWFTVQENKLYNLKKEGQKEPMLRLGSELMLGVDLSSGLWTLSLFQEPS